MPRLRTSPVSSAGAALLSLLVVAAPLARGGVRPAVQLTLAALAGLALAMVAVGSEQAPLLGLALLLPLIMGVLQVLPLSGGRAISLDPPASGRELASAAAMLLAFWAAWLVAETRQRREKVVFALGLSGVAVALVALGAAALGAQPLLAAAVPFVNSNHQSGLLNLAAFTSLGLALRRHGQARLTWFIAFVLVVAALFMGLSRGGIGAFFGGVALFLLLASRREANQPSDEPVHPWRRLLAAGLVAALAVVAYLALGPVLRELATLRGARDEIKFELWRPALQLIEEHPWQGIGRGAWATAYTALKTDPAQLTFTHLENEWLQPLVDLGVPAGLLLILTLGLVWLRAAVRRDLSPVEMGLLAGTAAVAVQNLVDFSLEFCGVGLPFMVALGLLTRGGWPVRLRWTWQLVGSLAVVLLAIAGGLFWRAHPTDQEALAVARAETPEQAAAAAAEALRWHPADYLPAATAGAQWMKEGRCGPAMAWLTRAMALNPTAPEPHQLAARCLAAAGQGEAARREYRLAVLYGSSDALGEAADRFASVEELFQVAPDTGDGLLALGSLLMSRERPEDAAAAFRRAVEGSLDTRALVPLARALLATGEQEEALELARRRTREVPTDPAGWQLAAQVLVAQGYEDEARATLDQGLAVLPGSPLLVEALVYRSLAARRPAEAKRLAETMAARTPNDQALRQLLVAAAFSAQGRPGEALERARSAAAVLPDSPWPLMAVAAYAQAAGRLDDAVAAIERAAALPGQRREDYEKRLTELNALIASQPERMLREELLRKK